MGLDIKYIEVDGTRRPMKLHCNLVLPFISSSSYNTDTIKQTHTRRYSA